jgi:hypothetical protein
LLNRNELSHREVESPVLAFGFYIFGFFAGAEMVRAHRPAHDFSVFGYPYPFGEAFSHEFLDVP